MKVKNTAALLLSGTMILTILTGCGINPAGTILAGSLSSKKEAQTEEGGIDPESLAKEAAALSEGTAAIDVDLYLDVEAPGTLEERNDYGVIDYSNTADGYITIRCADTGKKLKAQIEGPETTYTYTLHPEELEAFPLSDGNGSYNFTVYENTEGKKYAMVLAAECDVELEDEFAPYIRPNQYVNYKDAPKTREKAAELCSDTEDTTERVKIIYDYVIENITYDDVLAETVQSGYLPDLDDVLERKSGICFDYAALMTGMLRSLGIPCKLVVGYAADAYHAWINVWVEGSGWVDNIVYFDGVSWQRMDPTFASAGASSFIGNGDNYAPKYFY